MTDADGFTTDPEEYEIENGRLRITLPKTSAVVLKGKQDKKEKEEKQDDSKKVSPLQKLEFLLH